MNDNSVHERLEELKSIQGGWHDGYGLAQSPEGLTWLQQQMAERPDFPDPHIYPTPAGDVMFEWDIADFRPTLRINGITRKGSWHCLDLQTDEYEWRRVTLDNPDGWEWVEQSLRDLHTQTD